MDEDRGISWGYVFFGVLFLVAAVWLFRVFANMEASGGSMRINWIFALIYKRLGKWGVSGVIALVGFWMCWRGYKGGDPPVD